TFQILIGFGGLVARVGPEVDARRTFVAWSNTVAPVVLIGKTATGIANHTWFKFFQVVDEGFANAVVIRNFRLLAHPDAVVDHAAQMLNEVAVDIRGNGSNRLVEKYFNAGIRRFAAARHQQCSSAGRKHAA